MNQPSDMTVLRRNARQLKRSMEQLAQAILVMRVLGVSLTVISIVTVVIGMLWYDADFWHAFMVLGPALFALHLINDRRDTLEEHRNMTRSALSETLITMERELRSLKETP